MKLNPKQVSEVTRLVQEELMREEKETLKDKAETLKDKAETFKTEELQSKGDQSAEKSTDSDKKKEKQTQSGLPTSTVNENISLACDGIYSKTISYLVLGKRNKSTF